MFLLLSSSWVRFNDSVPTRDPLLFQNHDTVFRMFENPGHYDMKLFENLLLCEFLTCLIFLIIPFVLVQCFNADPQFLILHKNLPQVNLA